MLPKTSLAESGGSPAPPLNRKNPLSSILRVPWRRIENSFDLIIVNFQGCQILSAVMSASNILIEYSNTCLADHFEYLLILCEHHFLKTKIFTTSSNGFWSSIFLHIRPISTNLISFSLGASHFRQLELVFLIIKDDLSKMIAHRIL